MYTIELEHLPEAIALETGESGENITLSASAFVTDAHGEIFCEVMQTVQNLFLTRFLESGIPVSQIDHFLVLMKDNRATVYVNELRFIVETIVQRNIQKGEIVTLDDMMGIKKFSIQNLSVPDDTGIAFFFTVGWKRGFFFDFRPNSGIKLENLYHTLGHHYSSLLYSTLHGIEAELLKEVFDLGWFPFLSLIGRRQRKFERLVNRIREGKSINDTETQLIEAFSAEELEAIRERLRQNAFLKHHISILEAGIDRYQAQDYISCINNIWPRLEGILRYAYSAVSKERITSLLDNMEASLDSKVLSYPSIFFPKQFKDYLGSFYFQDFDLFKGQLQVSRHSIAHGVSNLGDYDRKRALLGILIADQLGHYLNLDSNINI